MLIGLFRQSCQMGASRMGIVLKKVSLGAWNVRSVHADADSIVFLEVKE